VGITRTAFYGGNACGDSLVDELIQQWVPEKPSVVEAGSILL